MTATETMTIRLDLKDKAMLTRLASTMKRSKSYLAAEAIRTYVTQEAAIVSSLRAGLEDMALGRVVDNETARQSCLKAIKKAARKSRA